MALLNVLSIPDPKLRQKALNIDVVDDSISKLMHDMLETMYHENGIGLAANQVGILKRILVIDIKDMDDENRPEGFYPLFVANPEFTFYSKETESFDEGCLSVPGEIIPVIRPKGIKMNYLDHNNQLQSIESNGFLARVLQHENDHLNGKTIVDYVSKLKRDILIKKLQRIGDNQSLEESA